MRELSAQLTALIAIAEDVLRRDRLPLVPFADLAAEIRHAHALPADGVRCTNAAIAVLAALDGLMAAPDGKSPMPWVMLVGAALPLLRAEAYQALCNERTT